ncbi:MAG TPA: hypothetical protein VL463_29865 [Kofleriaceae bacterium]|nr:hypothetical protein [Kofleriaceae bacterium]
MRWMCIAVIATGAACGGQGTTPPVDAPLQVIDGVIIYPDVPLPDAVSATTGAIDVTVRCGGSACGMTGYLKLALDDCNGGAVISSKTLLNKTLTSGVDITTTFDVLDPAMYCLTGFLSPGFHSMPMTGDAIASAGATHVTVVAGQVSPATLVLDSLQP